ncbi:MAG TPA: acyl-CoA dehydrogenase, partial [Microthrixaceae bacterium]|nr:acyl-CoA dehydrogenase [Microthrixaceae bacterium]
MPDPSEALVEERLEQLLAEHPPADTEPQRFLEAQYDLGLAWVHFPEGVGGLGVSPKLQRNVIRRVSEAGGPIGG